jgi:hypothetical protein
MGQLIMIVMQVICKRGVAQIWHLIAVASSLSGEAS